MCCQKYIRMLCLMWFLFNVTSLKSMSQCLMDNEKQFFVSPNSLPIRDNFENLVDRLFHASSKLSSFTATCTNCNTVYVNYIPAECSTCKNSDFYVEYTDYWDRLAN